jgi:hypothetical protein
MSTLDSKNVELYELIQRLLRLQEERLASRIQREHEMYALRTKELQWREADYKLEQETIATFRAIRAKLGVPEPLASEGAMGGPLNLEELFAQFGMKTTEPPLG